MPDYYKYKWGLNQYFINTIHCLHLNISSSFKKVISYCDHEEMFSLIIATDRDDTLYPSFCLEVCLLTIFLCLESFWPVILQIIVAKLPTVCFYALYQLLVCLAERTADLWMPLAWQSGITEGAPCTCMHVCVCTWVCPHELRHLWCPWVETNSEEVTIGQRVQQLGGGWNL